MVYLKIKERKAGENRKCTQRRCLASVWSRREQGAREAENLLSLRTDGGSWIPSPGNSSGIESILTQAPMGMWGNRDKPCSDALGMVLLRLKSSLAQGCWQDAIQPGAALSMR